MRAIEVVIWCGCELGSLVKTSLRNERGTPVAFWLTEDEHIYFRGYCSKCGQEIEFRYPLMSLLFDAPVKRVQQ